jgi:Spx/MgsR family transcriptional regulator
MYGIPHCDTIRKARAWLGAHGVPFAFHDYRKAGVDAALLDGWIDALGWEALLNRAGTTFRKLPEEQRTGIDRARATALMIAHPSIIKRPVLVHDGGVEAGFRADRYAALFG